ncbi:MAG: hypothetical protein K1X31_15850 [Gemmatimonadaceae bacterium]|nr:hypothetical protein [Gemmatimonadaceae bacterium]
MSRLARRFARAVLPWCLAWRAAHAQQAPAGRCPPGTDTIVAAGWAAYRADDLGRAAERFAAALAGCPLDHDATLGRAYVRLRAGAVAEADSLFAVLTARVPRSADAWEGRARSAERRGASVEAVSAWRQVVTLTADTAGAHRAARERLDRLAPGWDRSGPLPKRRAATLDLTMRVRGDRFELRDGDEWRPFYVQGVNLGVALPGRFPTEFPEDSARYARWLDQIAAMHANAVRTYTILPPAFYRALRGHNRTHPDALVHLIHGVWTEAPPRNDFGDRAFDEDFTQEIRRVVDLLHGAAEFPARPGHAGGRYDADVSPWVIAYVIGREWEPYAVGGYDADPRAPRRFLGSHLVLEAGTPTEAWLARHCDALLAYEEATYNAQRPIAFTNWPTTDPIRHATETSFADQMRFRGIPWRPDQARGPVHEEEGAALDPAHVRPTARAAAGWFASYHVYPYYPDFMLLDPGYRAAASSLGPSPYFGYLQELKRVTAGLPLLIAEFGLPTSRGDAHQHPTGWDHGGLGEARAAALYVRMAREIREAGAAGAIAFAWIDEWFKTNWSVVDAEQPAVHDPRWHNVLDPEEHYGLLALRAGPEGATPLPGGDVARWRALPIHAEGTLGAAGRARLRVGYDEAYVYLALEAEAWADRPFAWDVTRLQFAIDTYDAARGQHRLPTSGVRSAAGFEFLVELGAPDDGRLRVVPEYLVQAPLSLTLARDSWGVPFRHPVLSVPRDDAVFDSLWAMTNRPRYLPDGTLVPAQGLEVGRLRYGDASLLSIADWWYDQGAGMLQLRLPWGLLNVADPSSRRVLDERGGSEGTTVTAGFRIGVVALGRGGRVGGTLPALDADGRWPLDRLTLWTWPTWDTPTWHEYLKPAYTALQQLWRAP